MYDFTCLNRQEVIDYTLHHYNEAKILIKTKENIQAAQAFANVLKPYLSKLEYQNTQVDINYFKIEILDSLEQLGNLYWSKLNATNNYAKAAGIFQYCAAFAAKYQISDSQFFINQAHSIELDFLIHQCCTTNIVDLTKISQNTKAYKQKLVDIRETCQIELSKLKSSVDLSLDGRVAQVQQIYQKIGNSFVADLKPNHNTTDYQPLKKAKLNSTGFIQDLIVDCLAVMSNVPLNSEFTIMGLGSLASGRFTPWSDFEFAILIADNPKKYSCYKSFFSKFTQLLNIKIINLGETQLRNLGIELFNDFASGKEEGDWLWDTLINKGFCLDGAVWYACKTPIGRVGNYLVVEKTIVCNIAAITSKNSFDLIDTAKRIARLQHELPIDASTSISWFKSDANLVQALRTTILIYGNQHFLDDYRRHINLLSSNIIRDHSFTTLQTNLKEFFLKLDMFSESKVINIKKDIYRNIDSFLNALYNYYCINPEIGQSSISVWQIIDALVEKNYLNSIGAQHIREAVAIAFELRLDTYCYYNAQTEQLLVNKDYTVKLSNQAKQQLMIKAFNLSDTTLLHHYYYIMLAVQNTLHRLFAVMTNPQVKLYLFDCNFFENSNYTKGLVHAHFLEYTQALHYFTLAKSHKSCNFNILFNLFIVYNKLNKLDLALITAQELVQVGTLNFEKLPNNKNYIHLITSFYCAGNINFKLSSYATALDFHINALNLLLDTNYQVPILATIASYKACSILYFINGKSQTAIKLLEQVLQLKDNFLADQTDDFNLEVADLYDNMGIMYLLQNNFSQAKICYFQALMIKLVVYKHVANLAIASSFHNYGYVCFKLGRYDDAIKHLKKALAIFKNYDDFITITKISDLLINSYCLYLVDIIIANKFTIFDSIFDTTINLLAAKLTNLAKIQLAQHNFTDAIKIFEQLITLHKKLCLQDEEYLHSIQNNLYTILLIDQQYTKCSGLKALDNRLNLNSLTVSNNYYDINTLKIIDQNLALYNDNVLINHSHKHENCNLKTDELVNNYYHLFAIMEQYNHFINDFSIADNIEQVQSKIVNFADVNKIFVESNLYNRFVGDDSLVTDKADIT